MIFQSPSRIMLVRPTVFKFNPQTSLTNRFQKFVGDLSEEQIYKAAMQELDAIHEMYVSRGVGVEVFRSFDTATPDAIFPNSVSTFAGEVFGQRKPVAVLHPMHNENRRAERSEALVDFFKTLGYEIKADLLKFEKRGLALEGTGSVVMDHVNKIAYCALSPRSDQEAAEAFAEMIGYELKVFNTRDMNGRPVYHTDLVINICSGFAEVCAPLIVEEDRKKIISSLRDTHGDINELSARQFNAFCGNSLEVRNAQGEKFFSTATRALNARTPEQIALIKRHVKEIIHARVRMVERVGGGSDRCLTQELHGLNAAPVKRRENSSITISNLNASGSSESR